MPFLAFVFWNLAPAVIGAVTLRSLDRKGRLSPSEILAYGYLLGIAVVGFVSFLSGWAGTGFFWIKYVLFAASMACAVWVGVKKDFKAYLPKPSFPSSKKLLIAVPLLLLVGFRLFFSAFNTYYVPSYFDDEKGNWNAKAKQIYYADEIVTDDPKSLAYVGGGWHPEYPLQFILYKTYLTDIAGEWNEPLVNSVTVLFWLAVLVLVYASFQSPFWGVVAVYALCSLPLVSWHVGRAYFDLVVASYFLLALMNMRKYAITKDAIRLLLVGILAYSVVFTKNEGMVMVVPSLALGFAALWLLARKNPDLPKFSAKSVAIAAVPFAFIVPHMVFRAVYHLSFNPHSAMAAYGFHADSLKLYWMYFTQWGSFNVFWYALPLVLAMTWRKWSKPQNLPVAVSLSAMLSAMFAVFSFTNNYTFLLDQTTINRTLLIFMVPVTYFCILFLDPSTSEKA